MFRHQIKKGLEEMKRDMVEGLSEMRRFLRHHQVRIVCFVGSLHRNDSYHDVASLMQRH